MCHIRDSAERHTAASLVPRCHGCHMRMYITSLRLVWRLRVMPPRSSSEASNH